MHRYFFAGASEAEGPDKQGPAVMFAGVGSPRSTGIGREVVVAGVNDHLEIWGPRRAWYRPRQGLRRECGGCCRTFLRPNATDHVPVLADQVRGGARRAGRGETVVDANLQARGGHSELLACRPAWQRQS